MSKGHNRRPMQIPPEEFDQRWAETFGADSEPVDSIAAAYRELWRRFRVAVDNGPRQRAAEAIAKYVNEHRATLDAFGVGPLADPDGEFLRWSSDREHG